MGSPQITSFCCCMGLEGGSKCIGFAHLVISSILLIAMCLFAASTHDLVGTVEDVDLVYSTRYQIIVGVAVVTLLHVFLALTLLFSIYKLNTRGLRLWVYAMCPLTVLDGLMLFTATGVYDQNGYDMFFSISKGLAFLFIVCYCVLCVNSYYVTLSSAEDLRVLTREV